MTAAASKNVRVAAAPGDDVWGESDNCGGSPRERGSSLCPQDLAKLIEDCQRNLVSPIQSASFILRVSRDHTQSQL